MKQYTVLRIILLVLEFLKGKYPFTPSEVNFNLFVILLLLLMRRLLQIAGIRRQISMLEKTAALIAVLPNTGRCVLMHGHLELPQSLRDPEL